MRINSIAAWAVLAALALSAGCYAGQLAPTATLTVRIYNYAAVPDTTLIIAEADAIRIYREAGVELTLVGCPTFAADAGRYHACEQVPIALTFPQDPLNRWPPGYRPHPDRWASLSYQTHTFSTTGSSNG